MAELREWRGSCAPIQNSYATSKSLGDVPVAIIMSLWVHWRERTGRRSLYLLDVPFELAFLLAGIAIVLLIVLLRRLF